VSPLLAALLHTSFAFAGAFPGDGEVIGEVVTETVVHGDSLIEMARRHDLGFGEIAAANPGLDPFVPGTGSRVVLPTAWIVPELAPGTLLVNLSEMRLYLLLERDRARLLVTFPVGIGVDGNPTPLGSYRVVAKELSPTWHPPPSVRAEEPDLPASVPPGPDNPLGTHALRLSGGTILVHGTNRPYGVGRQVSHGCIRLYPEDIPVLYGMVPVGTPVRVVRQPLKVGVSAGRILVEVHRDDDAGLDFLQEARRLLAGRGLLDRVDETRLEAAVRERSGAPADVGR
jgi:L,D-transpeptidase ErfK/SrfK